MKHLAESGIVDPTRIEDSQVRRRLHASDCPYCGAAFAGRAGRGRVSPRAPTRDHVRPEWDGGSFVVITCWQCNNDKGHRFLSQWIEILRFQKDPRVAHVQAMIERYPDHARPSGRHHPDHAMGPRSETETYLAKLRSGTVDKPPPAVVEEDPKKPFGCKYCNKRFETAAACEMHANARHFRSIRFAKEEEAKRHDEERRLSESTRLEGVDDIL